MTLFVVIICLYLIGLVLHFVWLCHGDMKSGLELMHEIRSSSKYWGEAIRCILFWPISWPLEAILVHDPTLMSRLDELDSEDFDTAHDEVLKYLDE